MKFKFYQSQSLDLKESSPKFDSKSFQSSFGPKSERCVTRLLFELITLAIQLKLNKFKNNFILSIVYGVIPYVFFALHIYDVRRIFMPWWKVSRYYGRNRVGRWHLRFYPGPHPTASHHDINLREIFSEQYSATLPLPIVGYFPELSVPLVPDWSRPLAPDHYRRRADELQIRNPVLASIVNKHFHQRKFKPVLDDFMSRVKKYEGTTNSVLAQVISTLQTPIVGSVTLAGLICVIAFPQLAMLMMNFHTPTKFRLKPFAAATQPAEGAEGPGPAVDDDLIDFPPLPTGDIKHVPAYSSEMFADWVKDFQTACPSDLDYILTGEEERHPDPNTDMDEELTGNRACNNRNSSYCTQPFPVQDFNSLRSTEHVAG